MWGGGGRRTTRITHKQGFVENHTDSPEEKDFDVFSSSLTCLKLSITSSVPNIFLMQSLDRCLPFLNDG
jgi:hypothetical protein